MKDGYQDAWDILCCSDSSGACDGCSRGTMAYVSGSIYSNEYGQFDRYQPDKVAKEIFMRFCPDGFEADYEDSVIGLTIFHELMHMTSIVGDHGGYDRAGMV